MNKKIIIGISLAVLLTSISITKTYANEAQLYESDTQNLGSQQRIHVSQTFGNGYTTPITQIIVHNFGQDFTDSVKNTTSNVATYICFSPTYTTSTACTTGTKYAPITISTTSIYATYTFSTATPTSTTYISYIHITAVSGSPFNVGTLKGSTSDRYPKGECSYSTNADPTIQTACSLKDIYFQLTTQNETDFSQQNFISFLHPTNGITTKDFENWVIGLGNLASTTTYYIKIDYQSYGNNTSTRPDYTSFTGSTSSIWAFPKGTNLLPTISGNTWLWNATASIATDINFTNLMAQESISFSVNEYATTSPTTYQEYAGIENPYVAGAIAYDKKQRELEDCNKYTIGLFSSTTVEAVMCQILQSGASFVNYLFTPPQFALNNLKLELERYKNIFPFSIYFAILGDIKDASSIYNSATSTTLNLNVQTLSGESLRLVTIDSSTLKTAFTNTTTATRFGNLPACNTACAQAKVDTLHLPLKIAIWFTTGITIIAMIAML